MKILYIGDVVGRLGRATVKKLLPDLKKNKQIDLVIAQSENMTTGNGLTIKAVRELMDAGVDGFTGGNHSWRKAVFEPYFNDHSIPVIRPANYPADKPGRGSMIMTTPFGKVLVISLEGSRFGVEEQLPNPLRTADEILESHKDDKLAATIINLHGDLTSEKVASGYYFDGRASLVVGDHTHVPTADGRILPGGTATITDVGMTGPAGTVLGVKKEIIISRWLGEETGRFDRPDNGPAVMNAVLVDTDTGGKARSIEQIIIETEV